MRESFGTLRLEQPGQRSNGELLRAGALWLVRILDESHSIAQGIDSGRRILLGMH